MPARSTRGGFDGGDDSGAALEPAELALVSAKLRLEVATEVLFGTLALADILTLFFYLTIARLLLTPA